MGIWREWTWESYWEHIQLAGHAFLALGIEPGDRVAIHSENRPEWLISDMGALAARAASVGIYPTNPAAEVGYLLGDSGAKVLVAEDQEQVDKTLAVLDEAPDLQRIVYLEPRGHPAPLRPRDADVVGGVPRPRPRAPRAAPGRARRRARRPAARRPRDPGLHVRHDRPAQGRDAHRRQRRVRDARSWPSRAPSPTRRPARTTCTLSYLPLVARRRAHLQHLVQRRRGHPGELRRVDRDGAGQPARGAADGAVRRPPHLGEAARRHRDPALRRHLVQAQDGRVLARRRRPDRPAARRQRRLPHHGDAADVRRRLRVLLPRAQGPAGHAQGAVRRVRRRADRPRGAAVLHGHRGADARGLRDDRELGDRHRQPARARPARHRGRGARRHRDQDRRGDRRDPDPLGRHVRRLLAQARGHRRRRSPTTAGCTPATSASWSTGRT